MKIILDNKTHWLDADLRRFIRECGKIELPNWTWSGYQWHELHVRVRYIKNSRTHDYSTGYAYYNSNRMTIRLASANPDKVDLALVIVHEMGHLKGLKHPDMRGDSRYRRVGRYRERYAWANELPLTKTPEKETVRLRGAELIEKKITAIDAALSRWDTKRKRAETAIKKYKQKRRYYERRAAAMKAKP